MPRHAIAWGEVGAIADCLSTGTVERHSYVRSAADYLEVTSYLAQKMSRTRLLAAVEHSTWVGR
jgi:hypothetical protein